MSETTIKDFLTEYRALCVKHGCLIVTNPDEQITVGILAGTSVILVQSKTGGLRFITIDELRIMVRRTQEESYVLLPGPDEIEQAIQKKESIFRDQLHAQVRKINEKQSK